MKTSNFAKMSSMMKSGTISTRDRQKTEHTRQNS
jgi:hypothetical protein